MSVIVDTFCKLNRTNFYFGYPYKLKRFFFSEVFFHYCFSIVAILGKYVITSKIRICTNETPKIAFDFYNYV